MELPPEKVVTFAPGRFFTDAGGAVVSLDFHRTEDLLVAAGACVCAVYFPRLCRRRHHHPLLAC
jgi:hypothetical protein